MESPTFRHYQKGEFKSYWEKYEIFSPESFKHNQFFHIVKVGDVEEAEIIAAYFMRSTGTSMDSTSFNKEANLLYLNYGNTMMPSLNGRSTKRIIDFLLANPNIKGIKKDGLNQFLFAQDFYGHSGGY